MYYAIENLWKNRLFRKKNIFGDPPRISLKTHKTNPEKTQENPRKPKPPPRKPFAHSPAALI
jgi:hypothetical protein